MRKFGAHEWPGGMNGGFETRPVATSFAERWHSAPHHGPVGGPFGLDWVSRADGDLLRGFQWMEISRMYVAMTCM